MRSVGARATIRSVVGARAAIRSVGFREAVRWHVHAWGDALRPALRYPISGREPRRLVVDATHWMRQQTLPTISLDELAVEIPDQSSIRMHANAPYQHNCSALELYTLAVITRVISPRRALEIGTFDGRSTLAIAMNTEGFCLHAEHSTHRRPPSLSRSQLSSKVRSGARFLEHPQRDRIEQLWGDSRTFDFAPYHGMQLIFIDGAHDDQTVRQDTATALGFSTATTERSSGTTPSPMGSGESCPNLWRTAPIYLIRGTEIALLRWSHGEPKRFSKATAASALPIRQSASAAAAQGP